MAAPGVVKGSKRSFATTPKNGNLANLCVTVKVGDAQKLSIPQSCWKVLNGRGAVLVTASILSRSSRKPAAQVAFARARTVVKIMGSHWFAE